jgi:hypothetical protein
MDDAELRRLLAPLPPQIRDVLRRAARADQWRLASVTERHSSPRWANDVRQHAKT